MKAVLVDDSELMRERVRAMLADVPGFEVVGEAADGASALTEIRRQQPDLVILDLQMPGLTGFDVLREMRPRPDHPPLVIVLTNHPYAEYRGAALRAGAHHFFDKSRELDQFTATVEDLALHFVPPASGGPGA
jgi:DNA-binding NarL/FixJ family response regulator